MDSLIAMARNALDLRRAARSWGDRLGLKLNLSSVRPDRFGLPVFLHSLRAPPGRVGIVLSSGECRWVQGVGTAFSTSVSLGGQGTSFIRPDFSVSTDRQSTRLNYRHL